MQSDYLILLLANPKSFHCIPGRAYEYLYAKKKILAIVPENGCSADLIKKTNSGIIVSPNNIKQISETVLNFIKNHIRIEHTPNMDMINMFDRKNLTKKLADIFNILLENRNS